MARTLFTITGLLFLSVLLTDTSEAAPSTGTIQVAFILSEFEDQAYQDDHDQDYFNDLAPPKPKRTRKKAAPKKEVVEETETATTES